MGIFDIGTIAVIGAFAYAFYEQHTKTKIKLASAAKTDNNLQQEINQLKQRVATLEAIVTDKAYHLKNEINQL